MERRWLNEIERALNPHGIRIVSHKDGKKHAKIMVTDGKSTRFIVVSVSPSDHRATMNIVQNAKRMLNASIAR